MNHIICGNVVDVGDGITTIALASGERRVVTFTNNAIKHKLRVALKDEWKVRLLVSEAEHIQLVTFLQPPTGSVKKSVTMKVTDEKSLTGTQDLRPSAYGYALPFDYTVCVPYGWDLVDVGDVCKTGDKMHQAGAWLEYDSSAYGEEIRDDSPVTIRHEAEEQEDTVNESTRLPIEAFPHHFGYFGYNTAPTVSIPRGWGLVCAGLPSRAGDKVLLSRGWEDLDPTDVGQPIRDDVFTIRKIFQTKKETGVNSNTKITFPSKDKKYAKDLPPGTWFIHEGALYRKGQLDEKDIYVHVAQENPNRDGVEVFFDLMRNLEVEVVAVEINVTRVK